MFKHTDALQDVFFFIFFFLALLAVLIVCADFKCFLMFQRYSADLQNALCL